MKKYSGDGTLPLKLVNIKNYPKPRGGCNGKEGRKKARGEGEDEKDRGRRGEEG